MSALENKAISRLLHGDGSLDTPEVRAEFREMFEAMNRADHQRLARVLTFLHAQLMLATPVDA